MPLDSAGFYERVCEALEIEPGRGAKAKIAKKLGLTKTTAGAWEKGEMPGMNSLASVARVSEFSNASLHWLLTGEGPKRFSGSDADAQTLSLSTAQDGVTPDLKAEIHRQIIEVLSTLLLTERDKAFTEPLLAEIEQRLKPHKSKTKGVLK